MRWRKYLKDVYFSLKQGGSFQGVDKLYRTIRDEGKVHISRKDIKNFLKGQDTYTLHKEVRRNFDTNHIEVADVDKVWEADLADLIKYTSTNDGYRYLLGCIDTFSRKLFVRPLKTKNGSEITKALSDIFAQTGRKPRTIRSDRGSEFTNKVVTKYLEENTIGHIFTSNQTQAAYIERVWKSLKLRMEKYFMEYHTTRYIDVLKDLVAGYNNTFHSVIGMTPNEVNDDTHMQAEYNMMVSRRKRSSPGTIPRIGRKKMVPLHLLAEKDNNKPRKFLFEVGTHVRLTLRPEKITSEYKERWTREIFQIHSRRRRNGIPVYKVKDLVGEVLDGTFYTEELQEVSPDAKNKTYQIDKVLKERVFATPGGKRRRQYYVSFIGFPRKFNQWVPASAVKEWYVQPSAVNKDPN